MSKCYISIDPGSKGFVTVKTDEGYVFRSLEDEDLYSISSLFKELRNKYDKDNIICVMESIHAIFGSSAKATFSFGEIFGKLQGLLIAHRIPYILVQPKEWQKEIWINDDMVYTYKKAYIKGKEVTKKTIVTKATSINAAKRLFPNMDLRKTERCKNVDDNKVDSLLLNEYARRKNL